MGWGDAWTFYPGGKGEQIQHEDSKLRTLEWDGDRERVINDPEADKLLRRKYRAPWKYLIA